MKVTSVLDMYGTCQLTLEDGGFFVVKGEAEYLLGCDVIRIGQSIIHQGRIICLEDTMIPRPFFELVTGTIERATLESVGFDLFYTGDEPVYLHPLQPKRLKTGVRTRFSPWLQAIIKDKSGIAGMGIETLAGVIESDYADEWEVVLVNVGHGSKVVDCGSKIAQVILVEKPAPEYRGAGILFKNDTRTGGFGSTGKVSISVV